MKSLGSFILCSLLACSIKKFLLIFILAVVSCTAVKHDSEVSIASPNPSVKNAPTEYVEKSTVFLKLASNDHSYNCTGVLVTSRRILTADHCMDIVKKNDEVTVSFGSDPSGFLEAWRNFQEFNIDRSQLRGVTRIRRHPTSDLATLDLTEEAPKGSKPVVIHSPETPLPKGQEVVVAGFGPVCDSKVKEKEYLRWGWMNFDKWLEADTGGEGARRRTYPNALRFTPGSGNSSVCRGDSGGPVFALLENKIWGLVGIISMSHQEGGEYNATSADARANAAWILDSN